MSPEARFQRIGVVAKLSSREALANAEELAEWLTRRGIDTVVEEATAHAAGLTSYPTFRAGEDCDLVVVLGGDGTLLSVARRQAGGAPILGVNLGSLGFLTEIQRAELYPSLLEVFAGRYAIDERAVFDVSLERADGSRQLYRALNDAVITKSALARIIDLHLRVDDRLVARYRADGLILSTPTGSTAYNLSAGGPILQPQLGVAVITPICPHTLSLRPIVVPDTSLVEVSLETQSEKVYLTLDGQEGTEFAFRDRLRVTRCAEQVRLVRTSGRTFFDGLRGKLHWGE